MAQTVFISYSQADKQAADRICEILEQGGVDCWIAPRNIPAGTTWANSIVRGIERSKAMLLVCSENANQSRQMSRELQLADDHKLPIIPVRLSAAEPSGDFRYFLDNTQWFDAFPGTVDDHAERLVRAVKAALLPPGERTAATAAGWGAQAAAVASMKPASPGTPAPRPGPPAATPANAGGQKKTGLIVAVAAVVVAAGAGSIYLFKGQSPEPKPPIVQPDQPAGGGGDAKPEPASIKRPVVPKDPSGAVARPVTPAVKPPASDAKIPFVEMPPFQPRFPNGFRIAEHAVTVREFNEYLSSTAQTNAEATGAGPDEPVVKVPKRLAAGFCAWAAGKRGRGGLPERGEAQMVASAKPELGVGKKVWEQMDQGAAARNPRPTNILVIKGGAAVPAEELGFRCIADLAP